MTTPNISLVFRTGMAEAVKAAEIISGTTAEGAIYEDQGIYKTRTAASTAEEEGVYATTTITTVDHKRGDATATKTTATTRTINEKG